MRPLSISREWLLKYRENVLIKRLITVLGIDIMVKMSGIILLPIYLRLMTQDEYGLYGYLISIILTFSLILNFGLYIPISKYYHDYHDPKDRGKILFTFFSLLAVVFCLVVLPVYLFGLDYRIIKILFKNPIDYQNYRWFIFLAVLVSVCNFMLTNFFFSSEKIQEAKRYNIWRIVCINLISIGALVLFAGKGNVRIRLESTYLVELILFLFYFSLCLREMVFEFDWQIAVAGLKIALPVMISALFGIVTNFGDKFFLEKYGSFKDLSTYYLAVSCASIIPTIFASFQNAWLPLFFKEKDMQKKILKTNKVIVRLFALFILISIAIILFLKIVLVLGIIQKKYDEVIYVLPIMLITQIIAAMIPLYTNYLIHFEKTYIVSISGFLVCLLSLGTSLTLIPALGIYGAALVSLISNLTWFAIYYFVVKKYTQPYMAGEYQPPFA